MEPEAINLDNSLQVASAILFYMQKITEQEEYFFGELILWDADTLGMFLI